jgi:hypothetical protein
MCFLQGLLEICAVFYRRRLAKDGLLKSVWISASVVFAFVMFSLALFHLKQFRQIMLFLFSAVQMAAMSMLVVTLRQMRELIRVQESRVKVDTLAG